VARHVQALHGGDAPPGDLLRLDADPLLVAAARAVEERVDAVLTREGLWEGDGT
jgi:hypothetical protein